MKHESNIIIDFNQKRLKFEKPLQVWQTHKLENVKGIFEKVQEAIDGQFYVAGYVSYECAPAFERNLSVCESAAEFPLVWFGVYEKPIEEDINEKGLYFVSDWCESTSRVEYENNIETIHEAIARGETYQVNYSTRLHAKFTGDDFAYYEDLRDVQQTNYSAYLNVGRYRILSVSPELFFHWDRDVIRTKPMKGTVPKSESRKALFESEKNRTENVMIVDLLRNDLGRIAKTGTIKVPKLFEIEEYPTLFQMTSTVEANTKAGSSLFDVFQAMFPCGSITGAPKISTMKIISSLEKEPRHIYCGAIGLAVPGEGITFNVAIRTVLVDTHTQLAVYGVGGGVIWDSTAEGEYDEMRTKSRVLTYRNEQNGNEHINNEKQVGGNNEL
ncbi:aminodeoxychorismate synthase component I [Paenibacillus radicis (ex Xue et al. 2023)]|uniref:Aminodeoxychorismate synthase component I n=1 Tax=Paenibacillus radicis (ex Xue et al. 2023) TaxID=2972489 RepID=A0ABT1YAH8_9BACL|nr:aminodeoxychorismate synthase component I [Paenibacillus radicis (ex Xue et al. 2023)]MCR8630199.1 aminodeoxychorismate synthase component I [Paenibacillus radicis (ex Xue et al. 2023)]